MKEEGEKKENGVLFEDVGSSCIIYPLVRPLLQVSVTFLPSRFFRVHLEEERGRARKSEEEARPTITGHVLGGCVRKNT